MAKKAKKVETKTDKSVAELAREHNVDYALLYNRLRRGWSMEKALNTPARKKAKSKKKKASQSESLTAEVKTILDDNDLKKHEIKAKLAPPVEKVEPPLISEKAEQSLAFMWFMTALGVAIIATLMFWDQV